MGSLAYAWNDAYGEVAPWAKRHPEVFTKPQLDKQTDFNPPFFDPGARLHRDTSKLGSMPEGIPEGMRAHAAFSAQWGSLSKAAGLDAIMLRDSFGMPVPYKRAGPWGTVATSARLIGDATDNVSALVRETKSANTNALVMMYSNGASAMSDWRSNGLDLERVAKEGFLDIYVDQTWAGAWNEVGVRHNSFWNLPTLGWTYQLAYTLMHGAMLSGTKVRHYPLIETFDAWESWDVLHSVPDRLRWGIWAYSHASVKTPHGIEVPAGSYISWANQGKNVLSPADVEFLKTNIDAAVIDAHKTKQVYGPVLVYARSTTQWQATHAQPHADVKEWLDEQAGSVIKWPVPILSATRIEWLPKIEADMLVFGAPSHLSLQELQTVTQIASERKPVAIFGSTAGGIDGQLQTIAGISTVTPGKIAPSIRNGSTEASGAALVANVPSHFPLRQSFNKNLLHAEAKAIYSVEDSPALILNANPKNQLLLWDPPEFEDDWDVPLKQIWGGSGAPYALAAGAMNALLDQANTLHATHIDLEQTVNVSAWTTTDGTLHILAGNLEEGLRDDADMGRTTTLQLPNWSRKMVWSSVWPISHSEKSTSFSNSSAGPDGTLEIRPAPADSLQLEGHAAP